MQQSNVIFFYIFAAFVIFITMRGELPIYLGFLLASPKKPGVVAGATPSATGAAAWSDLAIKGAELAAM